MTNHSSTSSGHASARTQQRPSKRAERSTERTVLYQPGMKATYSCWASLWRAHSSSSVSTPTTAAIIT